MIQRYRNYGLLLALFTVTAVCQYGSAIAIIHDLRLGTERARNPMQFGFHMRAISGMTPEATSAGIHWGDELEEVDGQAFTGLNIFAGALSRLHPGDSLPVVVSRPDGTRLRASIKLAAARVAPPTLAQWLITTAVQIALPLLCLGLGFWVAAVRPADPKAWLLLGLLISFWRRLWRRRMRGGLSAWPCWRGSQERAALGPFGCSCLEFIFPNAPLWIADFPGSSGF